MPHRNPHAAVTPSGIELGAEHVHCVAGSFYRHLVVELATEHVMPPIIECVVTGHLQERGAAVGQPIWNVIAHQRSIIGKSLLQQQIERVLREFVGRSSVTNRARTSKALYHLDAAREPVSLLLARELVGVFMQIPVMSYLVAIRERGLHSRGVTLDAPGRDE